MIFFSYRMSYSAESICLPRQDVFQDVPRALAVDIRNCAGNFDVGTLQHFLEPVQFTVTLPNEALAVADKFTEFPLVLIRDVARRKQAMLQKICNPLCILHIRFCGPERLSYGGH